MHPPDALEDADVSLLCVGTPSTTSGETNLAYIYRVVEDLIQPLKTSRSGTRIPHRGDPQHGAARHRRGRHGHLAGRVPGFGTGCRGRDVPRVPP